MNTILERVVRLEYLIESNKQPRMDDNQPKSKSTNRISASILAPHRQSGK
jgi:hypothetical protein